MFGLGPMELIIIAVVACFTFVVPIVLLVVLIRLVAKKDRNDQRPGS